MELVEEQRFGCWDSEGGGTKVEAICIVVLAVKEVPS